MKKDEFNIVFFKYIREEINKRIDIHYKLVLAKFSLAGGLFAFLLSNSARIGISAFPVTGVFALLVDIVILENLGWIRNAGNFIKQNIEDTDLNILKWETDCAQTQSSWMCFSSIGYILGIWFIAPALLLGGFIFDFDLKNKPEIFIFAIGSYLIAYTLFLIFKQLGANVTFNIQKRKSPIIE